MPGLLDDYGPLLRGKPKLMPPGADLDPTAPVAMTAGDEIDPFGGARRAEALEVRGAAPAPMPGGTLAGPNQQRAFAAGDQPGAGFGPTPPQDRNLGIALGDRAPPRTNLAEMNFGLGDNFPGPKLGARLAEGLPMTGPEPKTLASPGTGLVASAAPSPAGGGGPSLLTPNAVAGAGPQAPSSLPLTAPLPPVRPPAQLAGMQGANGPQWRTDPPLPPSRPAGLTPGGNTPPPNPILPPSIGTPPASMATAAPTITPPPIAPPAPIAPPVAPAAAGAGAGAAGAAGGAAGGLGGLGGVLGGIAGIAKAIGGKPPPAAPPAKPPQIQPMSPDTTAASRAQGGQQAMAQGLAGILGNTSLIDPRKRQQGLV